MGCTVLTVPPFRVAVWVGELPGDPVEVERPSCRQFPATYLTREPESLSVAVEVSTARQPREWYGLIGGVFRPDEGLVFNLEVLCRRWAESFGPAEREVALEPFADSALLPGWYPRIAMGIYADGERELYASVCDEMNEAVIPGGSLIMSHGATRPFKGAAHREAMDVLLRVLRNPLDVHLDQLVAELAIVWEERGRPSALPW